MHTPIVALVSADPTSRTVLEHALSDCGGTLLTATTTDAGVRLLATRQDITLVICDDSSGRISRAVVLAQARQIPGAVPVVVLGSSDTAKAAIEAIREGASDYLPTPLSADAVNTSILNARAIRPSEDTPEDLLGFEHIISVSPQMQLVKRLAAEVAATDATVLITGESGTGKELFARAIHATSLRSKGPFVAINCAGIPEPLLESELFGYQRGAFTDAKQAKPGKFQMAAGGTLFLDEIGEMSLSAQAKLLRVLEDHVIDPLGDTNSIKVNIRVIAATNEDLPAQIKAGRFRLDLFYRLNVYQLRIPPLHERPDDIEPIFTSFSIMREGITAAEFGASRLKHSPSCNGTTGPVTCANCTTSWKGSRSAARVTPYTRNTYRPRSARQKHLRRRSGRKKASMLAFGLSFHEIEKNILEEALRKAAGNVSQASRLLKITRNTLRYRMAKYHIS